MTKNPDKQEQVHVHIRRSSFTCSVLIIRSAVSSSINVQKVHFPLEIFFIIYGMQNSFNILRTAPEYACCT